MVAILPIRYWMVVTILMRWGSRSQSRLCAVKAALSRRCERVVSQTNSCGMVDILFNRCGLVVSQCRSCVACVACVGLMGLLSDLCGMLVSQCSSSWIVDTLSVSCAELFLPGRCERSVSQPSSCGMV